MKQQDTVTEERLLKDLQHSVAQPSKISKKEYDRSTLPCILIVLALGALELIYSKTLLWVCVGLLVLIPVFIVVSRLTVRYRVKHVRLSDYELRWETLTHKDEEHFRTVAGKHRSEQVNRYLLCFACGNWELAKKNYAWRQEGHLSDYGIFQEAHRGDLFLLAVRKKDGKILLAYSPSRFSFRLSGVEQPPQAEA